MLCLLSAYFSLSSSFCWCSSSSCLYLATLYSAYSLASLAASSGVCSSWTYFSLWSCFYLATLLTAYSLASLAASPRTLTCSSERTSSCFASYSFLASSSLAYSLCLILSSTLSSATFLFLMISSRFAYSSWSLYNCYIFSICLIYSSYKSLYF